MNNISWEAIKQNNGLYNIYYYIHCTITHGVVEAGLEVEDVREEDVKRVLDDLSYDSDRHYDDDAFIKFRESDYDSRANYSD